MMCIVGMQFYLCMKAALTEPRLLEMTLNFHLATSTWLVQVARDNEVKKFEPVTFPLPEQVPIALGYTPEFIMGNVTDFAMFLHRFKDELYEVGMISRHDLLDFCTGTKIWSLKCRQNVLVEIDILCHNTQSAGAVGLVIQFKFLLGD